MPTPEAPALSFLPCWTSWLGTRPGAVLHARTEEGVSVSVASQLPGTEPLLFRFLLPK